MLIVRSKSEVKKMATKKMGRPPKENPRNKKLTIRVTEKELNDIDECAKSLGISKTELVIQGVQMVCSAIKKDN